MLVVVTFVHAQMPALESKSMLDIPAAAGIAKPVLLTREARDPSRTTCGLTEPIVVVGISEAGIPFDAPDGHPAHIVFLLLTPRADPAVQLDLSADISHLFRNSGATGCVLRAADFVEVSAALKVAALK